VEGRGEMRGSAGGELWKELPDVRDEWCWVMQECAVDGRSPRRARKSSSGGVKSKL
jgi:hypothetical protein